MGKIVIVDDCLAPARFIYLDYSGPDPYGVAKKIAGMLQPFFSVSSAGVSETDFKWDNSGDPITFFFSWWVQKSFGRSTMWVRIKVQGTKGKTKNVGNFTMELKGEIKTAFSYSTSLLKPIWWIYSYLFYNRRKRNYVEICRDYLERLRREIADHYNMKSRET
jgi:hypothetical protein